jgi:hypothetical protein
MEDLGSGGYGGGWSLQGCVQLGSGHAGVGVAFDPADEERLWTSDGDGFLTSYTLPDLQLYSSTRACWVSTYDDAAWGISNLQSHGLRPTVAAR